MKTEFTMKSAVALALLLSAPLAQAQNPATSGFAVPAQGAAYADVADLVVMSPLILDGQIRKVTKLPET